MKERNGRDNGLEPPRKKRRRGAFKEALKHLTSPTQNVEKERKGGGESGGERGNNLELASEKKCENFLQVKIECFSFFFSSWDKRKRQSFSPLCPSFAPGTAVCVRESWRKKKRLLTL